MFRQSLRRCVRISGASFAAPALRTTRPVVLKSIAQPSQIALRAPASLNAFRLYSSEAAAAAPEQSADAPQQKSGSISRFEDLRTLGVHDNLVNSITKGLKYDTMTDVQSKTIEPALKGMDMVAQAKTGTGKTLAFLVPILQRMISADPSLATRRARFSADASDIRGIIISPTRELAEQIAVEAEKLCQGTGLVVQRAVGGTQKRQMLMETRRRGCHLLVGTPGRLNDLLSDRSSGIRAPNLAAIVLDEADRMLDVGFERELQDIVSQLPDAKETQRQTLLFSATIPSNVINLARQWVRPDNFDFIQTVSKDDVLTHEKVKQHVVNCRGWGNVLPSLYELMHTELEKRAKNPDLLPFKALVFLPTTGFVELASEVDRSMKQMRSQYDRVWSWRIHSKLTQPARTKAADQFRAATSGILFSSDVTARGLDFPNVTHVIQVGAPSDREQYIHRLGRTGRAKKEGEGWLILPESDIRKARTELAGLPIEPSALESAKVDFTRGETSSEITKAVTKAASEVPEMVLEKAYLSLWGQFDTRTAQAKADELKEWWVDGMQKDNVPFMSRQALEKRGIRNIQGMNTTSPRRPSYEDDQPRGYGRDSGRGWGSDSGRGFGRDSGRGFGRDSGRGVGRDSGRRAPRDGFEKMEQDRFGDKRGGRPQQRAQRSSF
ncbi:ATP-dependent RNA helicase cyt-19 [Colletotrichum gloeosporioides]|uniref:ATP-dependent RNA helicase n=1 Tax=Colletotrichum gloeosporioides TaxID=474922 RepID=A0A8H4CNC7_COLGL|nr:ATP-dependent RNA helicase cyt-19 [Colletotrichum gloeosporioides]KAF3807120.1 ATP-dependent RNA helicase cyt-19 [Colletotrichum gloeosporioides]